MSALNPGIHVFYPARDAVGYAYYNGSVWSGGEKLNVIGIPGPGRWETWGKWVDHTTLLLAPLYNGLGTCLSGGVIYVFGTGNDHSLYVSVFYGGDQNLHYIGSVPGVVTSDTVTALEIYENVRIYYKDSNTQNLASVTLQLSGQTMTVVQAPQPLNYAAGSVGYGPSAVLRGGHPNLAFRDASSHLRMMWDQGDGSWADISPTDAWTSYGPTAVNVGDDIFTLYHGATNRSLYVNVNGWSSDAWTQGIANAGNDAGNQDMIIGGGPGACVYGGRLFCFLQGASNQLCCQIYMGQQWLSNPWVVPNAGGAPLVTDLWWGPSPVAV